MDSANDRAKDLLDFPNKLELAVPMQSQYTTSKMSLR